MHRPPCQSSAALSRRRGFLLRTAVNRTPFQSPLICVRLSVAPAPADNNHDHDYHHYGDHEQRLSRVHGPADYVAQVGRPAFGDVVRVARGTATRAPASISTAAVGDDGSSVLWCTCLESGAVCWLLAQAGLVSAIFMPAGVFGACFNKFLLAKCNSFFKSMRPRCPRILLDRTQCALRRAT